jgi:hypothetical protein
MILPSVVEMQKQNRMKPAQICCSTGLWRVLGQMMPLGVKPQHQFCEITVNLLFQQQHRKSLQRCKIKKINDEERKGRGSKDRENMACDKG